MKSNNQSTVTSKGQITIPREIRDKMQLLSGSKLEFLCKDDYFIVLPLNKSVRNLKGILPKPNIVLIDEEINAIKEGKA